LLIEKEFTLTEYSPEKAGVGGSTPSLATIIPKNLATVIPQMSARFSPHSRRQLNGVSAMDR
jgi:hypothetical protein